MRAIMVQVLSYRWQCALVHLSSKGIFERVLGNSQNLQEGQRARI